MNPTNPEFARAASLLDAAPARSAAPVADDTAPQIREEEVWEALGGVIDPEIGLDLVTLGLVYEVEPIENAVRVTFTLTTPGCPMADILTQAVVHAVAGVPGVEHVLPNLVWEPRWHPGMIREGAW
jgi:metal-sulfur cluster biosynthetic enzyme